MSSPVRGAGLVIFKNVMGDNNQLKTVFLLLKPVKSKRHSWWTPPKGQLEKSELSIEAAIRETKEETNLINEKDFRILENFKREMHYHVSKLGMKRDKIVTYWLAQLNDSVDLDSIKLSSEHSEYKWMDLEMACQILDFEDMKSMLKECLAFINSL